MLAKTPEDPCPSRHPGPTVGSCALCRKQVCEACTGIKSKEKLICKFCLAELQERDKPRAPTTFLGKMIAFFGGSPGRPAPAKRVEVCGGGAHAQELKGSCQVCRKSVCPACTSEKKLSGQPVCMGCFESLFQIRDQMKIEEQRRFTGGIKGFLNFSRYVLIVTLLVALVVSGVLTGVLSIFHLLYPQSFVVFGEHWRNGEYVTMVSRDVPDLCYEIYERTWYEWWFEDGLRMPYEEWKKLQMEAAGVAPEQPR